MKLYFRLAAGGIRRNSRLYVPYIMTCSLMVMMYYITERALRRRNAPRDGRRLHHA